MKETIIGRERGVERTHWSLVLEAGDVLCLSLGGRPRVIHSRDEIMVCAGDIVTVDPSGLSPSFQKIDVSIPFLVTGVGGSNMSRHWTSLSLIDAEEFSRGESTTVALAVPTVHLNGTSREMLVKELETAYDALGAAYEAMRECGPNGRDYYPQGPGALERAIRQHFDRLSRVDSVRSELEALIGKISEAGKS